MDKCNHSNCSHSVTSVCQSLEELYFDRGPWSAALDGDETRLRNLLKKSSYPVDILDSAGYSSLHYAARAGHLHIVRLLSEQGAKMDLLTRSCQSSALHRAAYRGHNSVVTYLLACGADSRLQDCNGCTALHRAAEGGHYETCKLLKASNAELANILDHKQRYPKDCSTLPALKLLLSL